MANFSEVFEDVTKLGCKIHKEHYLDKGDYPIIDQGQKYIAGYSNNSEGLYSDVPAIIFGDHTRIIKYVDMPCFLGADGVKLLHVKDKDNDVKYLYYALCNARIPDTGYNRHFKWLKELEIPLPPLPEQRHIAAVLDKVSELIALRKRQLDLLDEMVKARFVEMFGDPVRNPKNLPTNQLSNYILFLTSGSRGWAKYCNDTGKEWFITIKNVKNCNISTDNMQNISPPDNAEARRTKVQEGDLLISITADLGRTGVVTKEIAAHGAYINQHLTCIRINRSILNPIYVAYYMESEAGKQQFETQNQTGVKAGLNFNSINGLKLMIPNIDEQNLFDAFVQEINKSKATVQQWLDRLNLLKNALMQEYFG